MPTYSGTGRTTTYLRERKLRKGAENNTKITSFFTPKQVQPQGAAITDLATSSNSDSDSDESRSTSEAEPEATSLEKDAITRSQQEAAQPFLDTAVDDDDDDNSGLEPPPVIDIVNTLIMEAKKFKSFTSLMHLHALKQFIELWEKYKHIPRICAPMMKASHTVAVSIGKGPYMARKLRTLYKYVARFRMLPPMSAGKHHAHPSLLNNERIAQAIRRYLTVLTDGEVS